MIAFSNSPVSRFFVNLSQHLFTQLSLSNTCSILDFPLKELEGSKNDHHFNTSGLKLSDSWSVNQKYIWN